MQSSSLSVPSMSLWRILFFLRVFAPSRFDSRFDPLFDARAKKEAGARRYTGLQIRLPGLDGPETHSHITAIGFDAAGREMIPRRIPPDLKIWPAPFDS